MLPTFQVLSSYVFGQWRFRSFPSSQEVLLDSVSLEIVFSKHSTLFLGSFRHINMLNYMKLPILYVKNSD